MQSIVIVEDDEIMARIITTFLKQSGYEVTRFSNGETAYAHLKEKTPDVLITDVLMPQMTGFELLALLKKEGKVPPTIVITGQQREEDVLEGLNYGVRDYIAKPISPKVVLAKVKNILGSKAA